MINLLRIHYIPGEDDVDAVADGGGESEERPGLLHAEAAQALPVHVHDLVAQPEPPVPERVSLKR